MNKTKKQVVAFIGVAGSGKDYRCRELGKQGYTTVSFAEPLRRISFTALGIPYDEGMKDYERLKQTKFINGLTLREFMEKLGTEGIRAFDDKFWVNCALKTIEDTKGDVCISDMRFLNEYQGVRNFCANNNYDFKVIFCDYKSERYQKYNSHISAQLAQFLRDNLNCKDGEDITIKISKVLIVGICGN